MSEIRISSTELPRTIGEVLGRLKYRRDSFIVEKSGKPVALLSPYPGPRSRGLKEVLGAWVMAGERDEDFADLLEEVGRADPPLEDPWASPWTRAPWSSSRDGGR